MTPEQKFRESQQEIDFDSDEPLECPIDRPEGEPCESCQ